MTEYKKAPAVTLDNVHQEIVSEHYFTALQGARMAGLDHMGKGDQMQEPTAPHPSLGKLTFCVLVLKNGFTVTGESACVSAVNFDAVEARRLAKQKAVDKAWAFMGFRLADRLAEEREKRAAAID